MRRKVLFVALVLLLTLALIPSVMAQEGDGGASAFCGNENSQAPEVHPVAQSIADRYGVSYDEVIGWFCDGEGAPEAEGASNNGQGRGFGRIMLALQTSKVTGRPTTDLLNEANNGKAWGRIWQEAGLIGRPEDGVPPGHANRPDHAGGPSDGGKGRPEDTGQPDCPEPGEDAPSDNAGTGGKGQGGGKGNSQSGPPDCPESPDDDSGDDG